MKTQISRFSHQPEKRYSGVYQQQGRMLTDGDWNELMEIVKQRLEDVLWDVIGSGVPRKGGLRVELKDGQWKIRPGCVYVDGIRGEVCGKEDKPLEPIAFNDQDDDFPNAPVPSGDYIFYADLWERPVISLEDSNLVDPGLYGADTCFRTQTMVQIKWCVASKDPEDPKQNSNRGDAVFDLHLLKTSADKTAYPIHTGNFLFRLEVHDVQGAPNNPTEITLKWSCENGGEQYPWDTKPDDFSQGQWIYEFYNDTSEKHLGVHLASVFRPLRWELSDKLEKPASIQVKLGDSTKEEKPTYVRRWDGYCTLERNDQGWKINESHPNQNSVNLIKDGMMLTVDIKSVLKMELDLNNKRFVTGDYWLAVVREQVEPQIEVLSKQPLGIMHHYLKLAPYKNGELQADSLEMQQRQDFLGLTKLIRRTGDTMTGPLTVDPQPAAELAVDVRGTLSATHFKLDPKRDPQGNPVTKDGAVLTYVSTGPAEWSEASLTSWKLEGGNLWLSGNLRCWLPAVCS